MNQSELREELKRSAARVLVVVPSWFRFSWVFSTSVAGAAPLRYCIAGEWLLSSNVLVGSVC